MKVLFLTRSTLYTVFGGDTVQVDATAKYLRKAGIQVDIRLAHQHIDYAMYDLIHVFNVIRPADTLRHLRNSKKPYVLSTIYVDFREYERKHRTGLAKLITNTFSGDQVEYGKVILRRLKNGEHIQSPEYIRIGHRASVKRLASNAAMLLPNSLSEAQRFAHDYNVFNEFKVVYNGIDEEKFTVSDSPVEKQEHTVLCVARIEGKKNQLNLVKALNNTRFQLKLIGQPAPNHMRYYEACREIAGPNISFEGFVPQEELYKYYQTAKVHVLPSWNETCGLSSLEGAYYNCNIVITDKGDTQEYYGDNAWYCDPGDPASIRAAIEQAAAAPASNKLKDKIRSVYNWEHAAQETLSAYRSVINNRL